MERGRPQTNPLSFLEPAPSLEVAYPLEGNTKSQGSHLTLAGQPVGYGLQKPIFLAWTVICIGVIITCLLVSDPAHLDLFYIYYQPIIPILFMFWLWGIAVRIFERNHIRYDVCFSVKDQRYLLFSRQLFQVAGIVTTLVLTNTALFSYHCAVNQLRAAALHPPFMYTSVIAFFLLPINFIFKDERMFFTATFGKVVSPFREVSWADFLLADILTSLSKPLSDAERGMCHLLAGSVMEPHSSDRMCGSSSWFIPFGLSLPFAWRLLQCLRVYMDTGNRAQLLNALKYSTAFPVIVLSSMNNHVVDEGRWDYFYKPLWLAAAFINSGYSYYWDVERDWDISFFSNRTGERTFWRLPKPLLRSELLYSRMFYIYLMVSNLLLRVSWTYKLSPHLRDNHLTVLCFTLLEAFRRFQWLFVRIEVELRKLQSAHPELGQLVPASSHSSGPGSRVPSVGPTRKPSKGLDALAEDGQGPGFSWGTS